MADAKHELNADDFISSVDESWDIEASVEDLHAPFSEYDFEGNLVPVKPSELQAEQAASSSIMNRTNAGITLEEAYWAFDMRESYLQRHASPMGMQADTTELQMKDFTTKSCNIWKSEAEAEIDLDCMDAESNDKSRNIYQERVSVNFRSDQLD